MEETIDHRDLLRRNVAGSPNHGTRWARAQLFPRWRELNLGERTALQ